MRTLLFKLFGLKKDKNINKILEEFKWAKEFRDIFSEGFEKVVNSLGKQEYTFLLESKNLEEIIDKSIALVNSELKRLNNRKIELGKKYKNINEDLPKVGGKIIDRCLQDIHDQGKINNYTKFLGIYIIMSHYKVEYNAGSDAVLIDKYEIGRVIISRLFDKVDLLKEQIEEQNRENKKIMMGLVEKGVTTTKGVEFNERIETNIAHIMYYLGNKIGLSKEKVREYGMKEIDLFIRKLGAEQITEGVESRLFNLLNMLGFKGLQSIPSFNLIKTSQAHRIMSSDYYLPTTDIKLSSGEKFLYDTQAEFRKIRNTNEYTGNFFGITGSIPITKGVKFRAGKIVIPKKKVEKLETVDRGTIYITNKKILYKGDKKTFSVNFNKLITTEISSYGLLIFKEGNENPYIIGLNEEDYMAFGSILSEVR